MTKKDLFLTVLSATILFAVLNLVVGWIRGPLDTGTLRTILMNNRPQNLESYGPGPVTTNYLVGSYGYVWYTANGNQSFRISVFRILNVLPNYVCEPELVGISFPVHEPQP